MVNGVGELMNRQIRALAGAIDRKETQADRAQAEEVGIVSTEVLAGQLRGCVGAKRLREREILRKRNLFRETVDR